MVNGFGTLSDLQQNAIHCRTDMNDRLSLLQYARVLILASHLETNELKALARERFQS